MRFFAVLIFAGMVAPGALAQHETFVLNPDASEVKMTLKTTHELVSGTFHAQSGEIEFDRSSARMSGSVVVLTGSGNTGNGSRDKKMTKDILKAQQYTTAVFAPKSYTGTLSASGDSMIQVSGVFTLLGTPHDLTLPMQVHIGQPNVTATAHFILPYVQWGVKNPSFLIWKADDDVAIDLTLRGQLKK
jgi:polyisoprenoid-binding protein YceI